MIGSQSPQKLPSLSLVLGGARSGKSRLAERLLTSSGRTRHYIATAQAWDDDRGGDWITHEAPRDVAAVLANLPADHVVLLDCATLWLTNVVLAEADVAQECAGLLAALVACKAPVVVVSNEVGWGIVPDNALARAFRDHQGRLNQQIAGAAGLVMGVMAGLPMVLKGHLPDGFEATF